MRFLLESEFDFKSLIKEARDRGVKTSDIFELTPNSHLVNPLRFIKQWFIINNIPFDESQKSKLYRAVIQGRDAHRKTLMGYLDSLGTRENYDKIPPASVINGQADGKHRALLAYLLGIDLPVIIKK